jgi:hypothetical protein
MSLRLRSRPERITEMTRRAHLPVLLRHAFGVEPEAMGIHTKSNVRMTPRAIALLMATGASLHLLPSSLAMLQQPHGLPVVKGYGEALSAMTIPAERLRAMARRTFTLAPRGARGMAAHEIDRVKAPPSNAVVAIGARAFFMAPLTR